MLRSFCLAIALACALAPRAARAQSSSELAAARALFSEGLEAARDGRWEEARERFERSYGIAPRATTLLNLAGAQVQTGRLVAGAESYRRFLAEARRGREARYRAQAQQALAEVEARIAHLRVRVEGLTDADTILIDGEELAAALEVELPMNPGRHTVVVRRGEEERARQEVRLAEGEHREVTLDATVDLRVGAAAGGRASAPDAALQATPAGDDSGVWIGVGVGIGVVVVAAIAIGVAFAVDEASAFYSGNLGPGSIQFE